MVKLKLKKKNKRYGGIAQRAKRAEAERDASQVQSAVAGWGVPYFGKNDMDLRVESQLQI